MQELIVIILMFSTANPFVLISLSETRRTEVNVTCNVWGVRPLTLYILHNAAIRWKHVLVGQDSSSQISYTLNVTESGYVQCLVSNNYGNYQNKKYNEVGQHGKHVLINCISYPLLTTCSCLCF